jgi:DGQHR domain-containing protein
LSKKSEKDNRESLASILVTQGKHKYHIVSMPSEILEDTCFTITREEDPIQGFQRRLDEKRADEIAKYIDEGRGSIPTAVILSAQDEADLNRNIQNKTISFKKDKRSFLIIDGQHRVWGFIKAKKNKHLRIPVVIYEGLSRVEEAKLFIDINRNQKEVPKELILDVQMLLEQVSEEEKVCNEIFTLFRVETDSILHSYINVGENQRGNLSRVVFNKSISPLVNEKLKDLDNEQRFDVINNYLHAVNKVFTEMDDELDGFIAKNTVFRGLLDISFYVIDKTYSKHAKLTEDAFYDVLKIIKDNINKRNIKSTGNSYKKFGERLLQALTKTYIPSTIITE